MNKDTNKQKWGNLLYIILPVILIFTMAYFMGEKSADVTPKYSEIVQIFRTGQVQEYELNLSSGALKYRLFTDKEEKKVYTYTVANVDIFLNDVHNYVVNFNLENSSKKIVY